VEDSEVRTGRRSEGLLNSADNLFKKIVSGVGVFVSGWILTLIVFPKGAKRGDVDPEILHGLGMMYLPINGAFYVAAILCLVLYNITQQSHEENLRKLGERELAADPAGGGAP